MKFFIPEVSTSLWWNTIDSLWLKWEGCFPWFGNTYREIYDRSGHLSVFKSSAGIIMWSLPELCLLKIHLTSRDFIVVKVDVMASFAAMDRNFRVWSNIKTDVLCSSGISVFYKVCKFPLFANHPSFVCQARFQLLGIMRHQTTVDGCLWFVWEFDLLLL